MSTEQNEQEASITAELAKPEDVTQYVEDRQEQEAAEAPRGPEDSDESEIKKLADDVREKYGLETDKKKASRYERLKRARDAFKAENEELRRRLGETEQAPADESNYAPTEGSNKSPEGTYERQLEDSLEASRGRHGERFDAAYTAFIEHVQRTGDAETYQQVMASTDAGEALVAWHAHQQGGQRDEMIAATGAMQARAEEFARRVPDFHEAMQVLKDWDIQVPNTFAEMIIRSPHGPQIVYALAKDLESGQAIALNLDGMSPQDQILLFGRIEGMIANQGGNAPQRATSAPPPVRPIRGGSGGPKDLHSLAANDDIGAYAAARGR